MKQEIKSSIESGKAILGVERTLKSLNNNLLKKIFLATNLPAEIKKDFERYSKLSDVEIIDTKISNEELGVICKKPFYVSVVGVLK